MHEILNKVSRETLEELIFYKNEIIKWNKQVNLISNNSVNEIWERHILDSAQLNLYLRNYNNILDIGSGGGFPAIILAILNKNKPKFTINLVEKLHKKTVFLQNIIAQLHLPAIVHNIRIEDYKINSNESIAITSRAFTSLDNILNLTDRFFKNIENIALLPKGCNYKTEIAEAEKKWLFSMDIYNSKLQDGSVILKLSKVKKIIEN